MVRWRNIGIGRTTSANLTGGQAALDLECDEDPDRFKERLAKPVKQEPVEKPE
jgi:hypothetical protein